MLKGSLRLVSTPLGSEVLDIFFTKTYLQLIKNTRYFVVENVKTAQVFIKKLIKEIDFKEKVFYEYSEHTTEEEVNNFLKLLLEGNDVILMSEVGSPCVADPGNKLVLLAHKNNIRVIPYIGHSSIILSLIASGLPAQKFVFEGYLPIKKDSRIYTLKKLEKFSRIRNTTVIFMETPYRTRSIFNDIITTLNSKTLLCVASNLTQTNENIRTQYISDWIKSKIVIDNVPSIFIIYAGKM